VTGSKDSSIKVWTQIWKPSELGNAVLHNKTSWNATNSPELICDISLALISELNGHIGSVRSLSIFRGQLISASGDHTTKIWDPVSGQCLRILGDPAVVAHVNLNGCNTLGGGRPGRVNILDHAARRYTSA